MYDLDLAVYILVIMMSQFVGCSHAKPVITSSQEKCQFYSSFCEDQPAANQEWYLRQEYFCNPP